MTNDAAPIRRHRWLSHGSEGLLVRLAVASRALAAIGGGYAVAALSAAVLALWLPLERVEATLAATLASFVIHVCAVMWVFAARSAWRAWLGLAVPAALLGVLLLARQAGSQA
ncbi:DUF3649 domain-containing protein [Variovorax saccharolyticus]|uniref:DUF3649 domain-containing protein n=1 Tax=Variovorax saccharolyticus TaxID=3053516 RepID=UPI00403799EE